MFEKCEDSVTMGKGKQMSVNLITQLVSFTLNLGISFFMTPYVIEFIGKDVYGFVSLASNFTSYVSAFTVALNGMLSRYVTIAFSKKDYESAGKYFSSVLIANVVIMIVLLPISVIFVANLGEFINLSAGFEADIKFLFALVFISFIVNLPGCCYNSATYAANRLDLSNISNMLGSILRIAVIMLMLLTLKPHVWYVGLGSLISTVFVIMLNVRYKQKLMPQVQISFKLFEWKSVKEILSVGIWNSINQMTQLLLTGLDLIIANLFISVTSMNMLSYAKMIPTQMLSLISTVAGTFAPAMTIAYANKSREGFVRQTNFAIKLCGFLCSVPTIGLVVFGEDFFGLWLQALSTNEIHLVAELSILTVLPYIFSVYVYPLYTVNTVTAKLKMPVLVSAVIGIVNIIIVFAFLQTTDLGIYVVAGVSSILSIGRIFLFAPLYAAHSIQVPYYTFYKPLIRGLLSSLIMMIVFVIIRRMTIINNWFSFFLICIFAAILGYIIAFGIVFSQEERRKVIEMVIDKFRR